MKKITIRLSIDNLQRVATQAHRVHKSVNAFAVGAMLANVDEAYQGARMQALMEAQTVAVVSAIAERFERADAQRKADIADTRAAIAAAVKQVTGDAAARDAELRADLRRSLDRIADAIRALRKENA